MPADGGSAKLPSVEWRDDVEAEGTGELEGLEPELGGLLVAVVAIILAVARVQRLGYVEMLMRRF